MAAVYQITHSLLSSWLYAIKDNPFEDATSDPKKDSNAQFYHALMREPTETSEAMQNGIDFENLVTAIVQGKGDESHKWYNAAKKVAACVKGGVLQFKASKRLQVNGRDIMLTGRLDCLKSGMIYDIKFSKSYDRGKYIASTQHPAYLKMISEALAFTYLVSNGSEVWTEMYTRSATPDIEPIISDFLAWLRITGMMPIYEDKWRLT